jgi:hypothetical protein
MPSPLTDWPGRYDLKIRQGATFRRRITWRDGNDDPVDLTDWTAVLKARRAAADSTPFLDLDETDGITLGDVAGTIEIELDAETTSALTWRRAVYDLKLTDPDGKATLLLEGVVIVIPQVSHDDPPPGP